jgi:CheY-like chemotaxis protein
MSLKTIIIDDDEITIFILKKMVIASGICNNPMSFLRAAEALEYMMNETTAEDNYLLLLDINMPEMNGWDFLNIISATPPKCNTQVAIVTSSVDTYDKECAAKYKQVIHFFEKPLSIVGLQQLKEHELLAHNFQTAKLLNT